MSLTIPTASSIKMRFPELADVDDPVVEFAIEEARADMGDGSNWSVNADLAMVYLSAHYVACAVQAASSGGGGGSGDIASESIGRLSITYARSTASVEATPDDKETTSYGKRYLAIVEGNFSGAGIV